MISKLLREEAGRPESKGIEVKKRVLTKSTISRRDYSLGFQAEEKVKLGMSR